MRRNDNLGTANNSASEQRPGLLEFIVLGIFAVGIEKDFGEAFDDADGEDVPGVGGDDVSGNEVDLLGSVGDAIGGEAAAVRIPALLDGALDLDAAETSAMFDDDVIGRAIAPRLGGTESECDGAGHEAQFGPLAAHLGVADGHSERFHRIWKRAKHAIHASQNARRVRAARPGPSFAQKTCSLRMTTTNGGNPHFWQMRPEMGHPGGPENLFRWKRVEIRKAALSAALFFYSLFLFYQFGWGKPARNWEIYLELPQRVSGNRGVLGA